MKMSVCCWCTLKAVEGESCVGKAESKGVHRSHLVMLVAAIAHEDSLAVDNLVSSGVWIIVRVAGIVCNAFFPTYRKMAGRILVAEEKARCGGASFFTGVPGFEDALHFILPIGD